MKVCIPNILRIHMSIFTIIGFGGLSLSDDYKRKVITERWLTLWSSLLLVAFNVVSLLSLISDDEYLFTNDVFGYFNDILKVVFANIAVTISYLETIFKREHYYKFWLIYDRLQDNSESQAGDSITLKELWKNRRFLVIFYTIIILETIAMILFVMYQTMSRHMFLFNTIFTPFVYAVHLRNMQFIFYIEILRLELVKLQEDLSLLVDYSRFMAYGCGFRGFEEFLRKKLLEKQKNYQMIFEMFEHFQNGFGFSIVVVILMIYVRVLVDAYFGYYTVYRDWDKTEIVLLIPACLQIPAFLITSKNCMDVVKLITFNLHSIISQYENHNSSVISTQLQNFSLQILHQRICINGIGITRMDGYMLTRAIGSITTYMIFFIQFMPKFTNFQDDKKN